MENGLADCQQNAGGNSGADYACHIGTHSVHQQEVAGILCLADLLRNSATINGQRELFLIDTGASTSMLDKKLCDEAKIYYMATGLEVIGVDGTSIPLKTTGRIPFTLDSIPYSASFAVQDMTSLRRATGKNVRGLIGSDVLGFYRLTVDFKTCELR